MSADFKAGPFKAYAHAGPCAEVLFLSIWHADAEEWKVGSFELSEITALAELAGHAWPSGPGVQVRWVIETRRPGQLDWEEAYVAADEEFVAAQYEQLSKLASMEWRLVHRTTLTADEVLSEEDHG